MLKSVEEAAIENLCLCSVPRLFSVLYWLEEGQHTLSEACRVTQMHPQPKWNKYTPCAEAGSALKDITSKFPGQGRWMVSFIHQTLGSSLPHESVTGTVPQHTNLCVLCFAKFVHKVVESLIATDISIIKALLLCRKCSEHNVCTCYVGYILIIFNFLTCISAGDKSNLNSP